jgi:hypothetical protein
VECEDAGTVTIEGLRTPDDQGTPVVAAEDVDEILVSDCDAPDEGLFLHVRSDEAGRVSLAGNHGDFEERVRVEADETVRF